MALVTTTIEEVDDEGACRTSKRILVLPILGVPPIHQLAPFCCSWQSTGVAVRDNGTATDEAPGAEEETGCSAMTGDLHNRMEDKQ